MMRGVSLVVSTVGLAMVLLGAAHAFALDASPMQVGAIPSAAAGPSATSHAILVTASGSFTSSVRTRYYYVKLSHSGTYYGKSFSGTIMSKGGVKVTFYRCRTRGVEADTTADLKLLHSTFTIKSGTSFSGKYLHKVAGGYYYYMKCAAAKSGKNGTYKIVTREVY